MAAGQPPTDAWKPFASIRVDSFSCLQAQQLARLLRRKAEVGARQLLHVAHGPETGQRERGFAT